MYREESRRPIVELAHMEIAEPSIEVAFGRCVEQGATLVAVSPFFLSPGRHWQEVRLPANNSYSSRHIVPRLSLDSLYPSTGHSHVDSGRSGEASGRWILCRSTLRTSSADDHNRGLAS